MPPIRTNRSTSRRKFAYPRGEWILRSYAQKEFPLTSRDLDYILPISCELNPHGGNNPVMRYNLCDVRALADRLAPTFGPDKRAEKNGTEIQAATARKRFRLDKCQLDRIKPVRTVLFKNKLGVECISKYYNLKDVQELAKQIADDTASPTGTACPAGYEFDPDDHNPFDGLSTDEAVDLLYRKTGIYPMCCVNH